MPELPDQPEPGWWVVRMVVDITVNNEPSAYEDRFVLVAASSENEARTQGEEAARRYEQTYLNPDQETVRWRVRGISDVRWVPDADLRNGTELYSAFMDAEIADGLMRAESPLQAWERQHPGRDSGQARVGEVLDAKGRSLTPTEASHMPDEAT